MFDEITDKGIDRYYADENDDEDEDDEEDEDED